MQGSRRKPNWRKWSRWVLWWKIDAAEIQHQVEGYATTHWFFTARGLGLVIMVMAGVSSMMFGGYVLSHYKDAWRMWYGAAGIADGVLFVVLASFTYGGKPWAMIGAIILWSLNILHADSVSDAASSGAIVYAAWLAASALGWTVFLHVLYVALCVERERKRVA